MYIYIYIHTHIDLYIWASIFFLEPRGTLWKWSFWSLITTIWSATQARTTHSKCSARISNRKLSFWMCWAPRNHIGNARLQMVSTNIQVKTTHATCSAIICKWKHEITNVQYEYPSENNTCNMFSNNFQVETTFSMLANKSTMHFNCPGRISKRGNTFHMFIVIRRGTS